MNQRIGQHDFNFDLGQKIHGVFAATVNFRVPLLTSKALDFGNGHALHSQAPPKPPSLPPI